MFEDEITIPFAPYSVNGQTNGIHMGRMAKVAIAFNELSSMATAL